VPPVNGLLFAMNLLDVPTGEVEEAQFRPDRLDGRRVGASIRVRNRVATPGRRRLAGPSSQLLGSGVLA
jgi:hypothetical protein